MSQIPQIKSEVNMGNSMRSDSITIKDMDKTIDLEIKNKVQMIFLLIIGQRNLKEKY